MTQAYNRLGFFPLNANAEIIELPIAASQTITEGDAVILDTGLVAIALANSARILGIAAESAVSNGSRVRTDAFELGKAKTTIKVYGVVNQDEIFVGCADGDGSSLVCGTEIDIVGATGAMYLDASESAVDVFTLLHIVPGEAVATARAMWTFRINKHALGTID